MTEYNNNILLVDKVYSAIKQRIVSGEYLPGKRLVEAELTEDFNVSRVTLREAMRRLVADNLVVLIPNSGIKVKELSYKEIVDIYAVRETVEALAARLAAQAGYDRLHNLKSICARGAEAVKQKDRISHRTLNNLFHREVALVSRNEALIQIIDRLSTQIIGNQYVALMSDLDLEYSQINHQDIYEAILAGNGDRAESAMRDHIRSGRKFISSYWPESIKEQYNF